MARKLAEKIAYKLRLSGYLAAYANSLQSRIAADLAPEIEEFGRAAYRQGEEAHDCSAETKRYQGELYEQATRRVDAAESRARTAEQEREDTQAKCTEMFDEAVRAEERARTARRDARQEIVRALCPLCASNVESKYGPPWFHLEKHGVKWRRIVCKSAAIRALAEPTRSGE